MATETLTRHICDRCGRIYSETPPPGDKPKNLFESQPPMLVLEMAGFLENNEKQLPRDTLKFDDLCPKCHSRIKDLVAAMRLDKEDKEKPVEKEKPIQVEKSEPKPVEKLLDGSAKPTDNKTKPDAKATAKAP